MFVIVEDPEDPQKLFQRKGTRTYVRTCGLSFTSGGVAATFCAVDLERSVLRVRGKK